MKVLRAAFCAATLLAPYAVMADGVAPSAEAPVVTNLSDSDLRDIQKFVAASVDHRTLPDGSMHAMIDGNELLAYLAGRRAVSQRLAKAAAQQDADPEGVKAKERAAAQIKQFDQDHAHAPVQMHGPNAQAPNLH